MNTLWRRSGAALMLVVGIYACAEEREDRRGYDAGNEKFMNPLDIASVALYQEKCTACHMAYQPEFLPKRSWEKIMNTLENHFGTNVSLDPQDQKEIQNVLMKYATMNDRIYDVKGRDVLRISQTPYFVREHHGVPKKIVMQPEVKSLANCTACHVKAASGSYHKREIHIPNYGQ